MLKIKTLDVVEKEVSEKSEELKECRICFSSTVSLSGDEPENLRS